MDAVLVECIGIVLTILLIVGFVWIWETIANWRRYRRAKKRIAAREKDSFEQAQRRARGSRW
jgi:hypothetical protein